MPLYAYCLSDEVTPETVEGAEGVAGAPVRLLRFGGLAAVVSEYGDGPVPVTRENVLAHNRVNARVLARVTPLPFRLGTLAGEERLAAYVEEHRRGLLASLERVRGCVEMGVKIIARAGSEREADADSPHAAAQGDADSAGAGSPSDAHAGRGGADAGRGGTGAAQSGTGAAGAGAGVGRGTAYLLSKRSAMAVGEAAGRSAEEVAAWLAGRLGDAARESRVRVAPAEALAVSAAYLVERARLAEYRGRVRAARAERGGSLKFLTSGAWPPYSFSDVRP